MSDQLIPVGDIAPSKYADDKAFDSVSSVGYLPRLQLMGSNTEAVKEGKINQGHYALVKSKDQLEDLTKEVGVYVLAWRPKALEITDDAVNSVYNPKSAEFERIAAKSEETDSGCMYGPEFLVYVPSQKTFATFFMSSKTARREAPQMKALMGKAALMRSQLIKAKKFSWHGPVIGPCSQPMETPSMAEVHDQVTKFNNPPEETTEAPEAANPDR